MIEIWIQDFVVVTADVRGSSANGDAFKHAVFRQLGAIETKDYIHILKYVVMHLQVYLHIRRGDTFLRILTHRKPKLTM